MPRDAIEQLREALRDGTHVFWPPFMGEAVLALLKRVEALEGRVPQADESELWRLVDPAEARYP